MYIYIDIIIISVRETIVSVVLPSRQLYPVNTSPSREMFRKPTGQREREELEHRQKKIEKRIRRENMELF